MGEPVNPPAFPRTPGHFLGGYDGMTLRDWFAGQALGGFVAIYGVEMSFDKAVSDSFELADAMLAERAK